MSKALQFEISYLLLFSSFLYLDVFQNLFEVSSKCLSFKKGARRITNKGFPFPVLPFSD